MSDVLWSFSDPKTSLIRRELPAQRVEQQREPGARAAQRRAQQRSRVEARGAREDAPVAQDDPVVRREPQGVAVERAVQVQVDRDAVRLALPAAAIAAPSESRIQTVCL
jgi:hypothetical protein